MKFASSMALQSAVYDRLGESQEVQALVGGAVFDAPPEGQVPPVFVMIGADDVRIRPDQSGSTAVHTITTEIRAENHSFLHAKTVAAAVCDALASEALELDEGELVSLSFRRARARRGRNGKGRGVELQFRAIVDHSDSNGEE